MSDLRGPAETPRGDCTKYPAPFDDAIQLKRGDRYRRAVDQAKIICSTCPVWRDCLRDNLKAPGVIAGLTRMERATAHLRKKAA